MLDCQQSCGAYKEEDTIKAQGGSWGWCGGLKAHSHPATIFSPAFPHYIMTPCGSCGMIILARCIRRLAVGQISSADRSGQSNIQQLRHYHRAIARLVAMGWKNSEVAARFGMSESRMSILVNSPLFRSEVERLQGNLEGQMADITKELADLRQRSVEVIAEELYQTERSQRRLGAAFNILDRTGHHRKVDMGIEGDNVTIVYNIPRPGDDLQQAKQAIEEQKALNCPKNGHSEGEEEDMKDAV